MKNLSQSKQKKISLEPIGCVQLIAKSYTNLLPRDFILLLTEKKVYRFKMQ